MPACKGFCVTPRMEKDRGYAWVVLVMSFLAHSVHQGFTAAVVGNLTVAQQVYFNIDLQSSSLIGSVHTGTVFLLAPIASVLIKKFGCRFTQILAGVLAVAGMGLSYLSTQPWHAYILFGVITAAGISFSYVTSSEILSQHFEKRKHLAFSVAVAGNFIGGSVWPVGSQYLLNKYGYAKAMGIMATPHVLHIIAGICFISPEECHENPSNGKENSKPSANPREGEEQPDTRAQCKENGGYNCSMSELSSEENNMADSQGDQQNELHVDGKDLQQKIPSRKQKETKAYSLKGSFVALLRTPSIWILFANAMAWNVTYTTLHVLINDYILKSIELDREQVALGITILGIGKFVGSMLVAATSSLKYNRLILHIITVTIYSIITIAVTYSHNKLTYYLFMTMWGIFCGASIANLVSTVMEFCGRDLLAVLFGLELCAEGIGGLALTPLATYIGAQTKEKYALIFAGAVGIAGSLMLVPVVIRKSRKGNDSTEVNTS